MKMSSLPQSCRSRMLRREKRAPHPRLACLLAFPFRTCTWLFSSGAGVVTGQVSLPGERATLPEGSVATGTARRVLTEEQGSAPRAEESPETDPRRPPGTERLTGLKKPVLEEGEKAVELSPGEAGHLKNEMVNRAQQQNLAQNPEQADGGEKKKQHGVRNTLNGYYEKYITSILDDAHGKRVAVNVNKVLPAASPQETYRYYDVPLACPPDLVYPQLMSLGQIVKGDRLVSSRLDFPRLPAKFYSAKLPDGDQYLDRFIHQEPERVVCTRYYGPEQLQDLREMIDRQFIFELEVDEFPISGFVGLKIDTETYDSYATLETQQKKEAKDDPNADMEAMTEYTATRMWGMYHQIMSDDDYPAEDADGKPLKYRYFLATRFNLQLTHQHGDIREVKMQEAPLKYLTEITEMPKDGSYLKVDWKLAVGWWPSEDSYPTTREEAIDQQIEDNDFHMWHDLDEDMDDEKKSEQWSWLDLPDSPKFRMRVHWMGIGNSLLILLVLLVVQVWYLSRNVTQDLLSPDHFYAEVAGSQGSVLPTSLGSSVEMTSMSGGAGKKKGTGVPGTGGTRELRPSELGIAIGWKLLHADVFRTPPMRLWLCASVGAGIQLLCMSFFVIACGCIEHFHHRGSVMSALFYGYIFSSLVGGYVSGSWYQRLGGQSWTLNMFATSVIFAGPCFAVWAAGNTIAIFYNSTAALPFLYIVLFLFLYVCVTVPLTLVGCALGRQVAIRDLRKSEQASYFPCRTNKLERKVPRSPWFCTPPVQYTICGLLPFSSLYVEIHYIFDSMWGPARYTVYGILLFAVLLALLNSGLVSVLFLYLQLSSENWRWYWNSFLSGAAAAAFFLLYCAYFFMTTEMDSFLQVSFYGLYCILLAYAAALIMGALTFVTCANFMRFIYKYAKSD
ncbi:unnamed protein product [Amoebophrya sp. A25]|nr:unnamed protein product [Amoebophrya sp. A25]|eukprot:GSA25T00008097001.1